MSRREIPFVARAAEQNLAVFRPNSIQRKWWDQAVQPHIDKGYAFQRLTASALGTAPAPSIRADVGWRWGESLSSIGLCFLVGRALGQRPVFLSLGLIGGDLRIRPIGMLLLAEYFVWKGDQNPCVFVWFLSDAPGAFFESQRIDRVKPLGRMLVDVAVCRSFHLGHSGRILLHADKNGGCELCDWYRNLGMHCISAEEVPSISAARQTNDGRFFYFRPEQAAEFSRGMDQFRPPNWERLNE
jgi:hypothetical protein